MTLLPDQLKNAKQKGYLDMTPRSIAAPPARKPVNSSYIPSPNTSMDDVVIGQGFENNASLEHDVKGLAISSSLTPTSVSEKSQQPVAESLESLETLELSPKNADNMPENEHTQQPPFLTLDLGADLQSLNFMDKEDQSPTVNDQNFVNEHNHHLHETDLQPELELDPTYQTYPNKSKHESFSFAKNPAAQRSVILNDREIIINHGVYIFDPLCDSSPSFGDEYFNPFSTPIY